MAIDIQVVAAELQRNVVQNKVVTKADFALAQETEIDKFCRKVTKINGTYQVLDSIMGHVVQGFKPEWQELGELSIQDKELKNYRQKVNFGFVPASVLGTFFAEWNDEDKEPTNKEIAKYIAMWVLSKVKDDVNLLSMIGEYNIALASGSFGWSLPGWNRIVRTALADTVRPVYRIPVDAFTDANIYAQVIRYEKGFPRILRRKIKAIHWSSNNAERFELAYKELFRNSPNYTEDGHMKSPLRKIPMVAHDNMADDIVFATVDGNMLNLIDTIDNPAKFTDVQVQDYKVKLFMEFAKGWDFLMNECVCVANFTTTVVGLGDDELMAKFYPNEQMVVEEEEVGG